MSLSVVVFGKILSGRQLTHGVGDGNRFALACLLPESLKINSQILSIFSHIIQYALLLSLSLTLSNLILLLTSKEIF